MSVRGAPEPAAFDTVDDTIRSNHYEAVFERVRYSPSSYNLQPWEFLVLQTDENRERLQDVAYGQEHVTDAPVAVAVLGNTDPTAHGEAVASDQLRKGYLPDEEAKESLLETIEGMSERDEESSISTRGTRRLC